MIIKRSTITLIYGIGDVLAIIGCFIISHLLKIESSKIVITDNMAHIERMNYLTTRFNSLVLFAIFSTVLLIMEIVISIYCKVRGNENDCVVYQMGVGMTSLLKAYNGCPNKTKLRVSEVTKELGIEDGFLSKEAEESSKKSEKKCK